MCYPSGLGPIDKRNTPNKTIWDWLTYAINASIFPSEGVFKAGSTVILHTCFGNIETMI